MASETNELTFVRCPTCRSLVPASASRCRICNATLDAGSKGAGTETPPSPGGRVRQKTVVAGPEEVKNMVSANVPPTPTAAPTQSAQTPPPPVNAAPAKDASEGTSSAIDEDDVFDPLGAFLQDLDSPAGSVEKSASAQPKKIDESTVKLFDDDDDDDDDDDEQDDDLDDLDLDDFDDPLLDDPLLDDLEQETTVAAQGSPVEAQEEPQEEEDDGTELEEMESFLDAPLEDQPRAQERREVSKPPPATPRRDVPQPDMPRPPETKRPQNRDPQPTPEHSAKPVQNVPPSRSGSGNPRPRIGGLPQRSSTPSGVSRAAPPTEQPLPPAARVSESRERPGRTGTVSPQVPQKVSGQHKPVAEVQPAMSAMRSKPDAAAPRTQARQVPERSTETAESAGARTSKAKQGRLFGWLVSYENPDGRAIELRAGRFFVTGTSIRPTDLILEDQSISTPHALMAITESGFQVQDLMSERGTFVRGQGEAQYTREEGVVEIRHGDWIRFGDVEFLVTIVPS